MLEAEDFPSRYPTEIHARFSTHTPAGPVAPKQTPQHTKDLTHEFDANMPCLKQTYTTYPALFEYAAIMRAASNVKFIS